MSSAEDQSGKNPTEPLSPFPRLGELDKAVWPYIWEKLITDRTGIRHLEKDVVRKFGVGEREARAAIRGEIVRAAQILQAYLLDGMSTRLNEVIRLEELYQKAWQREDIDLCLKILDRIEKLRDAIREMNKKAKSPPPASASGKAGKKQSGKIDDEIRQQVLREEMARLQAENSEREASEAKARQDEAKKNIESPKDEPTPEQKPAEQQPDIDKMSPGELR